MRYISRSEGCQLDFLYLHNIYLSCRRHNGVPVLTAPAFTRNIMLLSSWPIRQLISPHNLESRCQLHISLLLHVRMLPVRRSFTTTLIQMLYVVIWLAHLNSKGEVPGCKISQRGQKDGASNVLSFWSLFVVSGRGGELVVVVIGFARCNVRFSL